MLGKSEDSKSELSANEDLAMALPRLTAEQIAQVSPKFVREKYAPGAVIIKQGDQAERFYVVLSGRVEVWHESLGGDSAPVDMSGPGDYFGEIGLLKDQPRSATVRASIGEGAEVLSLGHDDFQELIVESKATESELAREMIQRLINLADYQG